MKPLLWLLGLWTLCHAQGLVGNLFPPGVNNFSIFSSAGVSFPQTKLIAVGYSVQFLLQKDTFQARLSYANDDTAGQSIAVLHGAMDGVTIWFWDVPLVNNSSPLQCGYFKIPVSSAWYPKVTSNWTKGPPDNSCAFGNWKTSWELAASAKRKVLIEVDIQLCLNGNKIVSFFLLFLFFNFLFFCVVFLFIFYLFSVSFVSISSLWFFFLTFFFFFNQDKKRKSKRMKRTRKKLNEKEKEER